jgi:uncharacterized protein (DUF58 family)
MERSRVRRLLGSLLLLVAIGVAYVGQIQGQASLYWLTAGLAAAVVAAYLQLRTPSVRDRAPADRRAVAGVGGCHSCLTRA